MSHLLEVTRDAGLVFCSNCGYLVPANTITVYDGDELCETCLEEIHPRLSHVETCGCCGCEIDPVISCSMLNLVLCPGCADALGSVKSPFEVMIDLVERTEMYNELKCFEPENDPYLD